MLLLVSGGVESTSLWRRLLNEGTPVTAVHISAPTIANRQRQELDAVQAVASHLQQPVTIVKYEGPYHRDAEVHIGLLPNLLLALNEPRFMRGLCLEDKSDFDHGKRLYFARAVYNGLRLAGYPALPPEALSPWHPSFNLSKAEHMNSILDLLPLTWSCLSPVAEQPCGTCRACTLRSA